MSDPLPTIRIVDRADPAAVRRLSDALSAFNAAATGIDDGRELFAGYATTRASCTPGFMAGPGRERVGSSFFGCETINVAAGSAPR
jgi:hypothetical protein